ncbi:MAG: 5-methylthioadenosine/S-adenosylhomocysteine deaminase [Solirubrobacterales bacterium]|nr:5-methylthioadenosine/S-adenosylhomocysteine deaminase [Solirubrobacterales bacterium]
MSASPLTVTAAVLDGETVGLRCVDGTITALGADVAPEPGDETIDAAGAPLVAPLVNGHTHAAMTLFRGYGGDLPLLRWLREVVWPIEAKLEPEDVYWGVRLACAEMIRTGTTRFWDMYWHPGATARAVADAGLRATIGGPLFDADGGTEAMRETAQRDLDELAGFGEGIDSALAPHAIYTVSEGLLRWAAELAAERELPIHIHLSETEQEVDDCIERHGVRPAAYLDRLGVLGERTVLAHGVWLDEAELELIAERGCTVVTNPVANMKLAVGGVFPYPAARKVGVAVGLGTDGPGSNDSLDLLADLKVFALAQRHASGDPTVLPAEEAWRIATGVAGPMLGGEVNETHISHVRHGKCASLEIGARADFLLLRARSPELSLGELYSDLVYAASGSVVDTTVVGGRVLMRGGEVPGCEEIVARAVERSQRLGIGAT